MTTQPALDLNDGETQHQINSLIDQRLPPERPFLHDRSDKSCHRHKQKSSCASPSLLQLCNLSCKRLSRGEETRTMDGGDAFSELCVG